MTRRMSKAVKVVAILGVMAICLMLPGCAEKVRVITNPNDLAIDYDTSRLIKFEIIMEDDSVMEGELYPLVAPITVRNFVTLAESGYYNGTTFNRVISDKLIQCSGTGETPPYRIRGEFEENGWRNTLSHVRGTLSMSHVEGENDSAYSTFFILLENRTYYDGDYAAFGKITSGLINCDLISRVEVDGTSPVEPQTIREIRILGN